MSDVAKIVVGTLLVVGGAVISTLSFGAAAPLGMMMMSVGLGLFQDGVWGIDEEQASVRSNITGSQSDIPIIYGNHVEVGHVNADVYTWGDQGDILYMAGVLCITSDNGGEGIGAIRQIYNKSENVVMGGPLVLDTWGVLYAAAGIINNITSDLTTLTTFYVDGAGYGLRHYSYHAHSGADTDSSVDAMLAFTRPDSWPTTSKGDGLAYVVSQFGFDETLYSSLPQLMYIVDGNKIEDFRTSGPTLYDSYTNPALVLYDYLVCKRYGLGIDPSEIDITGTFTSAANWCDLTTELGGSEYGKLIGSGNGLSQGFLTPDTLIANGYQNPDAKIIFSAEIGDIIRITSGLNDGDEHEITAINKHGAYGALTFTITPDVAIYDTLFSFEIWRGDISAKYAMPNAEISGTLLTGTPHKDNIDKILETMRGKLYWQDGKIKLWVRKPETAQTFVLDSDTNVSDVEIIRGGIKEVFNTVSTRYVDPAQNYEIQEIVWPPYSETNLYLAEDNDVPSQLEVEYPLVQNSQIVWRLAEIALKESRQDVTVSITTTEAALQFSLGDVVKLNDDTAGWTAKEFWVFGMTISDENTVDMLLKEYNSSVYTSFGQMTESGTPGGRLPSPLYMEPPTALVLTSDNTTIVEVDDSGDNYLQYILAEWTPSASPNLYKEEVFYKRISMSYWTFGGQRYPRERDTVTPFKQELLVGSVGPGRDYDVKVEAVSRLGVRSEAVTDTITTGSVTGFGGTTPQIPTVQEQLDYDGSGNGTLTLIINDPDTLVTVVEYRKKVGTADWDVSWTDGGTVPSASYGPWSVAVGNKHNSHIAYRITYTVDAGSDMIENVVTFDTDDEPELAEGYLTVDTTDGDVFYFYVGDDDTLSVLYAASLTDWVDDAAAKTAAEAGTDIDGRTSDGPVQVYTGLAEADTVYLAVVARDAASGGGNSGSQVYRYALTRPSDTTTDTIPPTIQSDIIYDGAGDAKIYLTVDSWGSYSTGTVDFKAKIGKADWDAGWTNDPTSPYEHSITLDEKHGSHIKYRVSFGGLTIEDVVTLDLDVVPELQTVSIAVDDAGNATLVWAGDDDVDYIRWKSATGSDPAYPSWTTPISEGTRDPVDPPADNARNGEVVIASGMTEGEDVVCSFYCFNDTTNGYSLVQYKARNSYRSAGDAPQIPTVSAEFEDTQVTLALDDPDLRISSVAFKNYEDGVWDVSWTIDSSGPPWDVVRTVTLSEKHNSIVIWKVGYDSDASFIWGAATWDINDIPQWNSVQSSVDNAGDVWLIWVGDDDVDYLRYKTSLSDFPTWGADPDIEGTRDPTDPTEARSGRVKVYTDLAEGATCYISFYGFVSDGNTWTANLGKSQVTRLDPTRVPLVSPKVVDNTVELVIEDPGGRVSSVWFIEYENAIAGTWYEDTTEPYIATIAIGEKHNSVVVWKVGYDSDASWIWGAQSWDIDLRPELNHVSPDTDDNGDVTMQWTGDDDVGYMKYKTSTSDYPTWTNPLTDGDATRSPPTGFSKFERPTIHTGLNHDQTLYVTYFAFTEDDAYAPTTISSPWRFKTTRPSDTNTTDPSVSASIDVNDSGVTDVRYSGTGIASIRWGTSTDNFPASPVTLDTNGDFQPGSINEGQTRYVSLIGYSDAGGTQDATATLYLKITRPTDTNTDTIVPTVATTISNPSATTARLSLVVNDPDSLVVGVKFREKAGTGDWTLFGTPDGGNGSESTPYYENVAITEKHNSYVEYEVEYNQSGQKFLRGGATFDPDNIPEISSLSLIVDSNGNPRLTYSGDDDVGSILWDTITGTNPAWPTEAQVLAGTLAVGRTGSGIDVGYVAAGSKARVGVLAFTDDAGSVGQNPPTGELPYYVEVYRRPVGDDNLPTLSAFGKVGAGGATLVRWAGRGIQSVRYEKNATTTMPAPPTGGSGGTLDELTSSFGDGVQGNFGPGTLSRATPNVSIAIVGYSNTGGTGTESEPVELQLRFGGGIDELDDVPDSGDGTYRKTKGTHVDSTGRVTTVYRTTYGVNATGDDFFDAEEDDVNRVGGTIAADVSVSDGTTAMNHPKGQRLARVKSATNLDYGIAYDAEPKLFLCASATGEGRNLWGTNKYIGGTSAPPSSASIFWQEINILGNDNEGPATYPMLAATTGITETAQNQTFATPTTLTTTATSTGTATTSPDAVAWNDTYRSTYSGEISGGSKAGGWSVTLALWVKKDTADYLILDQVTHSGTVAASGTAIFDGTLLGFLTSLDTDDPFKVTIEAWTLPTGATISVVIEALRWYTKSGTIYYARAAEDDGIVAIVEVVGEVALITNESDT